MIRKINTKNQHSGDHADIFEDGCRSNAFQAAQENECRNHDEGDKHSLDTADGTERSYFYDEAQSSQLKLQIRQKECNADAGNKNPQRTTAVQIFYHVRLSDQFMTMAECAETRQYVIAYEICQAAIGQNIKGRAPTGICPAAGT